MSFRALQSVWYVLYTPRRCLDHDTKAKVSFPSTELKTKQTNSLFILLSYFYIVTLVLFMK